MHRHEGREYISGDHCPHCWRQSFEKAKAENTELRHALADARKVIHEAVDRIRPLMPFLLNYCRGTLPEPYDDYMLDKFEREQMDE